MSLSAGTHSFIDLAEKIIRGVWLTGRTSQKLELQSNYYHFESGLHNEGVWHNCVMGLNYYFAFQITKKQEYQEALDKVSKSLYNLNFDKAAAPASSSASTAQTQSCSHLFFTRIHSGNWINPSTAGAASGVYDISFYNEQRDKKLVANAMAAWFYHTIGEVHRPEELDVDELWSNVVKRFYSDHGNTWIRAIEEQQQQQHGGEVASITPKSARAVDLAVVLIGYYQYLKAKAATGVAEEGIKILQELVDLLLQEFEHWKVQAEKVEAAPGTKKENRFLWQDIWVCLALMMTYQQEKKQPLQQGDVGAASTASSATTTSGGGGAASIVFGSNYSKMEEVLVAMIQDLLETYQCDTTGLMLNEPKANGKSSWGSSLLRFANDNGLFLLLEEYFRYLCPSAATEQTQQGGSIYKFRESFDRWLPERLVESRTEDAWIIRENDSRGKRCLWAHSEIAFAFIFSNILRSGML